MTLSELASPRFYASLMAGLDLGRSGLATRAPGLQPQALEVDDDFEETKPCSWYVSVPEDPPKTPR